MLVKPDGMIRVRDLAGGGKPSTLESVRLIRAGLVTAWRLDDGHVWVNHAELTAAHLTHGDRLRAEEAARLASTHPDRHPPRPIRHPNPGPPPPV